MVGRFDELVNVKYLDVCSPLNEHCLLNWVPPVDSSHPLRCSYHKQFGTDTDSLPADSTTLLGCSVSITSCSGASLTAESPRNYMALMHM